MSAISKYCDRAVLLNQGVKLGEGSPKEMIDAYKRVLVGQYEMPETGGKGGLLQDKDIRAAAAKADGGTVNENVFGNGSAQENNSKENNSAENEASASEKSGRTALKKHPRTQAQGVNPQALEYGTKEAEIIVIM